MNNNSNKDSKKTSNRLPMFYIALCCCVLAIGVGGYISQSLSISETSSVSENAVAYTPKPVFTPAPIETLEPVEELQVFDEEYIPAIIPTEIPVAMIPDYTYDNPDTIYANADAEVFDGAIIPVEGDILQPYTDTPYYNEVFGDWRTHNGIDIAASEGCEVICAANGEVKSIRSTIYGQEITVSHSDGYETVYSQLTPVDTLNEGSNVRCGDVIGTVTASKGEPVKEAHLHFEVKCDGKYINPADYVSN